MNGFSVTFTNTEAVFFSNDQKETKQKIKTFLSMATIAIATSSVTSQGLVNVKPEINTHSSYSYNKKIQQTERSKVDKVNFTNDIHKDDTISMNNDTLEVDDLADKVTQTQIEEIKSHFDTKLTSLENTLTLKIESEKQSIINDLKEFIAEENRSIKEETKSIKKAKTSKWYFWIGSVIVPVVTVIGTLFATKYFGLY